jgi:hypothetical protein
VYLKEVRTGDLESSLALMFSAIDDPTNHSVAILDTFEDSVNKSISYLVMPFLRLTDNPRFEVVEDVLDFTDQILEVRLGHNLTKLHRRQRIVRVSSLCIHMGLHIGLSFILP